MELKIYKAEFESSDFFLVFTGDSILWMKPSSSFGVTTPVFLKALKTDSEIILTDEAPEAGIVDEVLAKIDSENLEDLLEPGAEIETWPGPIDCRSCEDL